jgi:hypothetical protein
VIGEPPLSCGSNQSKLIVELVLEISVGSCGGVGNCAAIMFNKLPEVTLFPTAFVATTPNA